MSARLDTAYIRWLVPFLKMGRGKHTPQKKHYSRRTLATALTLVMGLEKARR